ncbi:uncharacterized protein LOC110857016 [Folsomia candida]|uniref:uncharacterized protein LOC110856807 n=1 Tax=Folsomia candida TaxID=158441 RepID=UPI000B8F57B3|nr:uncharacterized protein LOC110856807 [Folsomia candida]XP_021961307.1 uncharacterized protein LOC110857016 [Folsomia candida]
MTLSSEVSVLYLELDLYRQTLIGSRITSCKFSDELNRLAYALHCLHWEAKNLDEAIRQAGSRSVVYNQSAWSVSHRAYLLRHEIRFSKAQFGIWVNLIKNPPTKSTIFSSPSHSESSEGQGPSRSVYWWSPQRKQASQEKVAYK